MRLLSCVEAAEEAESVEFTESLELLQRACQAFYKLSLCYSLQRQLKAQSEKCRFVTNILSMIVALGGVVSTRLYIYIYVYVYVYVCFFVLVGTWRPNPCIINR